MNNTVEEEFRIIEKLWFLRRPIQFAADITVLVAAFFIAYLPVINIQMQDYYFESALTQLPFVIFIQFSILFLSGAYSILWRYISFSDITLFIKAAAISGIILVGLRYFLIFSNFSMWQVPVSVILIDTVLAFGGLLGLRMLRRFLYELGDKKTLRFSAKKIERKPALVVGAGRTGAALAKEVSGRGDAELFIRGFVDDDLRKAGHSLNGIHVLGTTNDLPHLVEEMGIKKVVIAIDHAQGGEIRRILDTCSAIPVRTQIVPSLNEIAQGHVSVSRVRDVQIEDLLGRDPIELDDANLKEFLSGKTVLITGAGGSIGSELVRQIAGYAPAKLLLIERSEYFLFQIGREITKEFPELTVHQLLADITDQKLMREIFTAHRPSVIFHAAAHKHVPMMEANPVEAIKNNVFGTANIARIAGESGATDFVMISTDKAVNPTSVMGASKRIAEIIVQDINRQFETNYIAVRFGNVLGSAGSVVPIFREQIQNGEPLTVTDPKMTRYFMTIPEAAQLVMQAGALGSGGEIFILDMGEPVKILDLAEDMIRLSGLIPYEDIDIKFTGIRKGEKLFEELEITGEDLEKTRHPKIYIGKINAYDNEAVVEINRAFSNAVLDHNAAAVRDMLNKFLPEATIITDQTVTTAKTAP